MILSSGTEVDNEFGHAFAALRIGFVVLQTHARSNIIESMECFSDG